MALSFAEFKRRDYRTKCSGCKRWMQMHPRAKDVTRTRRAVPHADRCTTCPPTAYSVIICQREGRSSCDQCRGLAVKNGRVVGVRLMPRSA